MSPQNNNVLFTADADSSYDVPEAIRVGRLLEAIEVVHYEEPCEFDRFADMKAVADAVKVPVACGEQEFSQYRFRWMIANHGADIVQPEPVLLRRHGPIDQSVARMANVAGLPIALHLSGGFIYMLHFGSATPTSPSIRNTSWGPRSTEAGSTRRSASGTAR